MDQITPDDRLGMEVSLPDHLKVAQTHSRVEAPRLACRRLERAYHSFLSLKVIYPEIGKDPMFTAALENLKQGTAIVKALHDG